LALRAAILKNDLEGFCRTYASEIINLVSGNAAKISELINYMLEKVEEILARYSEEKALSAPALPIIEENEEDDESEETIKEKKKITQKKKTIVPAVPACEKKLLLLFNSLRASVVFYAAGKTFHGAMGRKIPHCWRWSPSWAMGKRYYTVLCWYYGCVG